MKDNTKNLKEFLQKALSSTPDDFALTEVRQHIKIALSKVDKVEKDRAKREKSSQIRKEEVKAKKENPFYMDPKFIISSIDEMINIEKKKIENIKNKKNNHWTREEDSDEDIQFLG